MNNPKEKEFHQKNPLGRCPVLETSQGNLTQTSTILRYISYLSNSSQNTLEFAQIDQWLAFTASEVDPSLNLVMNTIFGHAKLDTGLY